MQTVAVAVGVWAVLAAFALLLFCTAAHAGHDEDVHLGWSYDD